MLEALGYLRHAGRTLHNYLRPPSPVDSARPLSYISVTHALPCSTTGTSDQMPRHGITSHTPKSMRQASPYQVVLPDCLNHPPDEPLTLEGNSLD